MLQYLPIYYYYTQLEMVQKRATEPYGLMPACTNINNPTQWKIYTNPPEYIDYGIYIKPPIPNEKIPINRKRTIESVLQTEIKFPVFSQVNVNDYTLPGELTSFEVRDAHDINRRLRDQTIQPANNLYGVTPNNTQRQQQQQQQKSNIKINILFQTKHIHTQMEHQLRETFFKHSFHYPSIYDKTSTFVNARGIYY